MSRAVRLVTPLLLFLACWHPPALAQQRDVESDREPLQSAHDHHSGHAMTLDREGSVMNENHDTLPRDCNEIRRDYQFTVRAGRAYAGEEPGVIFGMSEPELQVEPCSRIEITFVNEDEVRHQWMVHGLPRYLYPAGMFHIETNGGQTRSGTFIVPGDQKTYLVHCDMAQHMEKGMRAQLVVGRGSGDLWGIRGLTDEFRRDNYLPASTGWAVAAAAALGVLLGGLVLRRVNRR